MALDQSSIFQCELFHNLPLSVTEAATSQRQPVGPDGCQNGFLVKMEAGAKIIHHAIILGAIGQPVHTQKQRGMKIDRQKLYGAPSPNGDLGLMTSLAPSRQDRPSRRWRHLAFSPMCRRHPVGPSRPSHRRACGPLLYLRLNTPAPLTRKRMPKPGVLSSGSQWSRLPAGSFKPLTLDWVNLRDASNDLWDGDGTD